MSWLDRFRKNKKAPLPLGPKYSAEELEQVYAQLARMGARENDLASFVKARFEESRASRSEVERDMILGHRFADGQQWSGWSSKTREVYSLLESEEEKDLVVTDNLIGMLCQKLAALLNQADPEMEPAPSTDSPLNEAAAAEARAVLADLSRRMKRREQRFMVTRWALEAGFVAVKVGWDPAASMEVAKLKGGQVVGRESVALGYVAEEIVPGWEIYLPPTARLASEARSLVHATVKDAEFVRGLGKEWDHLKPDAFARGAMSPVWLNFNALQNLAIPTKGADAYSVLDYWHLPTPGVLPEGLRVVVVAGEVVHAGPWPYAKRDALPFCCLSWKESLGTPYGKSLAAELAGLQVAYNRCLSDAVNNLANAMPTMLYPTGTELLPGSYTVRNKNRKYREVSYNRMDGGGAPGWQEGPPLSGSISFIKEWVWGDMQHIAGIHDSTLGATSRDLSGAALEILRRGDQTQHAPFLAALEGLQRSIAEWEIALVAQFALPYVPYMMGLDESGSPGKRPGKLGAVALSALTNGGSVSMHLSPSSGIARTPEARRADAMEKHDKGLLGVPGSPVARMRLARLSDDADSSQLEHWAQEDLEQQVREAEAAAAAAAAAAGAPPAAGGAPGAPGGGLDPMAGLDPTGGLDPLSGQGLEPDTDDLGGPGDFDLDDLEGE